MTLKTVVILIIYLLKLYGRPIECLMFLFLAGLQKVLLSDRFFNCGFYIEMSSLSNNSIMLMKYNEIWFLQNKNEIKFSKYKIYLSYCVIRLKD